jgi:hypothetical protein
MGLYTIPQHIETSWREPPEHDDPLEHVEHIRERKPWKRDREAVRLAMQRRINERRQSNPMLVDARGEPVGHRSKDHSLRFAELNYLHAEIYRFRMGVGFGPRRSHRFDALARLHRIADLIPYFDKPRLP